MIKLLGPVDNRGCFQFLGIPTKGELDALLRRKVSPKLFPISRDPPEGGTTKLT